MAQVVGQRQVELVRRVVLAVQIDKGHGGTLARGERRPCRHGTKAVARGKTIRKSLNSGPNQQTCTGHTDLPPESVQAMNVRATAGFVITLAILSGCGGGSDGPSTPTAPTPPPPTPPATVNLNGIVRSNHNNAGIAGAVVTITDGANAGRTATTTSTGAYSFTGLQRANANVFARAEGWHENAGGLFIDGNTNLNFILGIIPFERSGSGNAVFDVPLRQTRVAVFARWSGQGTSNFILRHVNGFSIVNEILRERNPYTGTHITEGGRLETVSSGNIVEWRITEQP